MCLGSGKQSAYFISSYPSPSAEESHRSQVSLTLARLTEQKKKLLNLKPAEPRCHMVSAKDISIDVDLMRLIPADEVYIIHRFFFLTTNKTSIEFNVSLYVGPLYETGTVYKAFKYL